MLMASMDPVSIPALSAEQEELFRLIEDTREHVFVTGRAGTGKSTSLAAMISDTVFLVGSRSAGRFCGTEKVATRLNSGSAPAVPARSNEARAARARGWRMGRFR